MKPDAGTSVEYVADDPTINQYPYIKTSHAIIDGTVESNNNFYMYSEKDKWILQGKTKIIARQKQRVLQILDNKHLEIRVYSQLPGR